MQHPNPAGLVGHEFHHHYYHTVSKIKDEGRALGDDMLAWAIVNVEVEGVAGEIDKGDVPKMSLAELEKRYVDKSDFEYYKQYQIEYARSNEWLKFSEKYLEQIADNPEQRRTVGKKLHDELPDNGRAMGTFMSEAIIKELGRKRLVGVLGDPFAFWQVYNEAPKRSGGKAYVLSDKAMGIIAHTRNEYRS